MATAEAQKALSIECPRCNAKVDELCKSKAGKPAPIHTSRYKAAGVSPTPAPRKRTAARTAPPAKKAATKRPGARRKPGRPPKVVSMNSATIGEFMDDLEKLRDKWALNGGTTISVVDNETKGTLTATYDQGAWLVSMGSK